MLDKGFQKDMSSLDVVCYLCEWQGKLTSYEVFVYLEVILYQF